MSFGTLDWVVLGLFMLALIGIAVPSAARDEGTQGGFHVQMAL